MKKSIIKEIIKEEIVKILEEDKKSSKQSLADEFYKYSKTANLDGIDDKEASTLKSIVTKIIKAAKNNESTKLNMIKKYADEVKIEDEGSNKKETTEKKPEKKDDKKDDKKEK